MQIKSKSRRVLAYLILCSLFIFEYFNYGSFGLPNGTSPDKNEIGMASLNVTCRNSSMSDKVYARRGFMEAGDIYEELCYLKIGQARCLWDKSSFPFLTVTAAFYTAWLLYSRLTYKIHTPFNSNRIVYFLHKKDGMK